MKNIRYLLVLVPVALGAAASAIVQALLSPVPVLVFKMDIGMVIFIFGVFLTLFVALAAAGYARSQKNNQGLIINLRREEEESRRRFIRRLDHEIKNPLTGLQAAIANMQEASSLRERQRAGENARRTVERLARLLADLRKLSDLDERSLESLPVDISELLQDIVEAASEHPSGSGREVNLMLARVPWPLPPVTGDRDLLGLAFYNLIQNALKFSAPEDTVEVRAREDGRWLVIEVADGGPGIPEEDLPNIFEELYRGANARGVEGSGLGLALVKRILALHKGEVQVRSRLDGRRGTIFTIHLPANRS